MKDYVFAMLFLALAVTGCGTHLNPDPVPLGNNRYQINVSGVAGLTVSSSITRDWNEAASKSCNGKPYDIITRSFTGKEQNGMEGIIECK